MISLSGFANECFSATFFLREFWALVLIKPISVKLMLLSPWPKPLLVFNAIEHVAEVFFLNQLMRMMWMMINFQALDVIWWWSWWVLEKLSHACRPNGCGEKMLSSKLRRYWTCSYRSSWYIQVISITTVLTSIAPRTLIIFFLEVNFIWIPSF